MSRVASIGVRAAGLVHVLLAHLVPHLLGVDDHAVEVEDDGLESQRVVAAVHVDERRRGGALLDRLDLADEERVVAGAKLVDRARDDPAGRAGEQARVVLAHLDPVPERRSAGRCGRSAARACSWSPASIDTAHSPASRSSSCSDASSAIEMPTSGGSSESETSDETVSPCAAAVDLGDDDRDAGRPAAEERALLGPASARGRA